MAEMMDLIVRGGTVVDGTGGAPFEADVAISGGKIAEVGKVSARGREEIDAKGRIVTPGFLDIHTHYDGQAIWSEEMTPSSSHGVTSVVMGNCGVGFAPCRKSDHEMLVKVMEGVEDIPEVVMTEGLTWDWETFPEFLDALDRRKHDIDIATQLPHSALRVYVMGQRAADREVATEDDLAKMSKLAREAVEAGALGFATSRLYIHRTADGDFIPTYGAADHELEAIALGLKAAGRGVLQVVANFGFSDNIPGEFSVLRRLAQISGRPLSFSLGTGNSGKENWREILGLTAQANAEGLNMKAQVFGRPIGIVIGHELSANPFSLLPSYQPLAKLPLAQRLVETAPPGSARQAAERSAGGRALRLCSPSDAISNSCSPSPIRRITSRRWTPASPPRHAGAAFARKNSLTICCWKRKATRCCMSRWPIIRTARWTRRWQ